MLTHQFCHLVFILWVKHVFYLIKNGSVTVDMSRTSEVRTLVLRTSVTRTIVTTTVECHFDENGSVTVEWSTPCMYNLVEKFSTVFELSSLYRGRTINLIGESYLAELFRRITHYLAEQFRQIARYLAEHLIHKNDILFNEMFLTLWMQECKYSGMHVNRYASMQACKYTIILYKYSSM